MSRRRRTLMSEKEDVHRLDRDQIYAYVDLIGYGNYFRGVAAILIVTLDDLRTDIDWTPQNVGDPLARDVEHALDVLSDIDWGDRFSVEIEDDPSEDEFPLGHSG
jgi:hypothetical protein